MKKKSFKIPRPYPFTGERLVKLRLGKGLTQREVAEALGYSSAQFVSNFERGIATPPVEKLKVLFRLFWMSERAQRELAECILDEERTILLDKLNLGKR